MAGADTIIQGERIYDPRERTISPRTEALVDALLIDEPDMSRAQALEHIREGAIAARAAGLSDDDEEICIACEEVIEDGALVYAENGEGGFIHAACCGPERESYCGEDGEPLKEGEPIPAPFVYRRNPAHG
jgi:hypothetical protein